MSPDRDSQLLDFKLSWRCMPLEPPSKILPRLWQKSGYGPSTTSTKKTVILLHEKLVIQRTFLQWSCKRNCYLLASLSTVRTFLFSVSLMRWKKMFNCCYWKTFCFFTSVRFLLCNRENSFENIIVSIFACLATVQYWSASLSIRNSTVNTSPR